MNLGPVSMNWLESIGVRSIADIQRIGPVEIYRLLQEQGFPVSLNLLYALEGAIMDVHWNKIPSSTKAELRRLVGKDKRR